MLSGKKNWQVELKEKICQVIKKIKEKKVGVSFSGGLDSSLLAKVCQDLGKNVTCLTIGFAGASDLDYARKVAGQFKLPFLTKELDVKKLEKDAKKLIRQVKFPNIIELEIGLAHFYSFFLAKENNLRTVLTANGLDAMFCGFDKYKEIFKKGKRKLQKALIEDVRHALENEKKYKKIAKFFKVKMISPFLRPEFIRFALGIPLNLKIKSPKDNLRKHILREVALNMGVPKIAAQRAKKAIQYSSKIDWAIENLAKGQGLTKKKTQLEGYKGIKDAYFKLYLTRK